MSKIQHFEIPVSDLKKSIKFYEAAFGWKFTKFMDDYYMIEAGPESEAGSNGGLMLKTPNSLQSVTNSVVVENIGESMKVIEKAGGRLLGDKIAIPGNGWVAYFMDFDDHVLGVYMVDTNVK